MMDARDFRWLKQRVSIEMVLRHRGLWTHLRPRGDRVVGPCPVHHGDNPTAFSVDTTNNLWYCFTGCQRGGDVVDLVRLMDHLSWPQTADALAELASPIPLAVPTDDTRPAFRPFLRSLPLIADAPFLRAKGIRPETARHFDAGFWPHTGFLEGCVAVRLHDNEGSPLGYAGRRLDPAPIARFGKWKLPPRLPKADLLYNHHRVAHVAANGLVVVECPWGVMRLAQIGVPATALLGTSLSPPVQRILARIPRLLLLMDGDPAGRAAASAISRALRSNTDVTVAHLPNDADPDHLDDATLRDLVSPIADP